MRVLFAILLLAACESSEPDGDASDTCGAAGYEGLVGALLAATTFPADLDARIIMPDTAVTLDFLPDRLNIHVNADGVIARVSCG